MQVKSGIAVSQGVRSGPAMVLGTEGFRIPQRFVSISAVETEIARFHSALDTVCEEITANEELAHERLGEQYSAIFAAHRQLIRDPKLIEEIETLIREKCYSPEHAVGRVVQRYSQMFQNLGNRFFQERAADLHDLEKRLLKTLLGERREELANLTKPVIVLANNLTPSETANLNPEFVLGFATETGGKTSHTAILAAALGIPAVVGVGSFMRDVVGGETVIIDGTSGEVVIDPDERTLEASRVSEERFRAFVKKLEALNRHPAITKCGERITLMGNIEFPEEVTPARNRGAEGIGLYRTEFLYLEKDREPSEEDHYAAYCQVISAFPDQEVVIRTLDLGADKIPASFHQLSHSENDPNLGLRSIRVSLQHLELFQTQLRAILRAAVLGKVRIMFPLVTTLTELRQAKAVLANVIEDLEDQNIPFQPNVKVGMMVEVPSAAIMAAEFAREVDFFSVGTNDLIQYTLASDRSDPAVAHLYRAADPSILRLLKMVIDAAEGAETRISVTVCGQMSSDPVYLPLLIGLGLRKLSVTPTAIPELKAVLRSLTVERARHIAKTVLERDHAQEVETYLRSELEAICPDLFCN